MAGVICAVILLDLVRFIATENFEGFIVNGSYSKINNFPYMACLFVTCPELGGETTMFNCGGSIVNQLIILTAAHCANDCQNRPGDNYVTVGNKNKFKGTPYPISKIIKHSGYSRPMNNDIAVAKLSRELIFGATVKRITLMKDPPYFDQPAMIAGWGRIREDPIQQSDVLMHTDQKVLPRQECLKTLPRMVDGFFCATVKTSGYMSLFDDNIHEEMVEILMDTIGNPHNYGDSGSPLVVRRHIQIGLSSHKFTGIDTKIGVYTDVGYYYDWIIKQISALNVTCTNKDGGCARPWGELADRGICKLAGP